MNENGLPLGILLDLDGTTVDTESQWRATEEEILAKYGVEWSSSITDQTAGQSLLLVSEILKDFGNIPCSATEICQKIVRMMASKLTRDGVHFRPGIESLFKRCDDANILCALVTSSYRSIAQVVFQHKPGRPFSTVIAGDDVKNSKPHPEPYLLAAQELGVDIHECIIVEDSPPGIASAYASGARVVVIPSSVKVELTGEMNILRSADELTFTVMRRIMAGEVINSFK